MKRPERYVVYLRVSTDRQNRSGLGLEAQRAAVEAFLSAGARIVEEVVEVESGRRNDRPELARALALCRAHRATLLVAKLDRLARNVAFVSTLMESGVDFTAADFPTANRLTVHILAAVAEHEARMISERTKAALAAAKARGVRLGGHRGRSGTAEDCARAREAQTRRSEERARDLEPLFDRLDPAGDLSLRAIAKALQEEGVPTVSGRGRWTAAGVARVRERNKILSRCDSPLRNRYIKEGNLSGEFDDPPSDRTVVRNLY